MRRVVITGMGAITPVGLSVEEFWNSVKEGKTNFAEVTRFDSSKYRAHMAAEINNFNAKDYMDFKSAKRMELFSQYAVAAAKEAIEQSGLDMTKEDPFRVGCSVGSGIGSMQVVEKSCEILNTKRTRQTESTDDSASDFQHGIRKCLHSVWTSRKKHQCCDCLRDRNPQYR